MKYLIVLLLSYTSFANITDITCNLNRQIVIENNFGRLIPFRNAQITLQNFDGTDSAFMTIQDRFGPTYEVFNRLWSVRSRCSFNSFCLSTNFSSMRGLTIEIPKNVLDDSSRFFTGRVRDNRNFRTYFANCRSI